MTLRASILALIGKRNASEGHGIDLTDRQACWIAALLLPYILASMLLGVGCAALGPMDRDYGPAPSPWGPMGTPVGWRYQDAPMERCAWCERTRDLNRHHLIPQSVNPALTHSQTNIVVLCRDCHFVLGHRCDWRRENRRIAEMLEAGKGGTP